MPWGGLVGVVEVDFGGPGEEGEGVFLAGEPRGGGPGDEADVLAGGEVVLAFEVADAGGGFVEGFGLFGGGGVGFFEEGLFREGLEHEEVAVAEVAHAEGEFLGEVGHEGVEVPEVAGHGGVEDGEAGGAGLGGGAGAEVALGGLEELVAEVAPEEVVEEGGGFVELVGGVGGLEVAGELVALGRGCGFDRGGVQGARICNPLERFPYPGEGRGFRRRGSEDVDWESAFLGRAGWRFPGRGRTTVRRRRSREECKPFPPLP